ncbi:uncharacterized protein LOC126101517 [Schistocerca cancellata]|uniref:uncharacterized protein LOC126101517 n=1 Tax=Schistocerca cancellata TaxID=274614 RepID=UPI002118308A|nr:uncharacterized protein LOC126101517 [Schistocerca cancellata]
MARQLRRSSQILIHTDGARVEWRADTGPGRLASIIRRPPTRDVTAACLATAPGRPGRAEGKASAPVAVPDGREGVVRQVSRAVYSGRGLGLETALFLVLRLAGRLLAPAPGQARPEGPVRRSAPAAPTTPAARQSRTGLIPQRRAGSDRICRDRHRRRSPALSRVIHRRGYAKCRPPLLASCVQKVAAAPTPPPPPPPRRSLCNLRAAHCCWLCVRRRGRGGLLPKYLAFPACHNLPDSRPPLTLQTRVS